MKNIGLLLVLLFASIILSFVQTIMLKSQDDGGKEKLRLINSDGETILTRFIVPEGFERVKINSGTFGEYLRLLHLKPENAIVKYFNGGIKNNNNVYCAVIDLDIGKKDLHQCADAVMRLRAEYFWYAKKYDKIHFNFTNGFRVDYKKWMKGYRIVVKGNRSYWIHSKKPSNTYLDFWEYMEMIFMYAGTSSLSKELIKKNIKKISIGDVFIKGGFPGHAVIVVDMAIDKKTGEKIFLLAQSYMPAQEIQILQNPINKDLNPWYSYDFGDVLQTPEWDFYKGQLKRF